MLLSPKKCNILHQSQSQQPNFKFSAILLVQLTWRVASPFKILQNFKCPNTVIHSLFHDPLNYPLRHGGNMNMGGGRQHTRQQTLWIIDWIGVRADSVKMRSTSLCNFRNTAFDQKPHPTSFQKAPRGSLSQKIIQSIHLRPSPWNNLSYWYDRWAKQSWQRNLECVLI